MATFLSHLEVAHAASLRAQQPTPVDKALETARRQVLVYPYVLQAGYRSVVALKSERTAAMERVAVAGATMHRVNGQQRWAQDQQTDPNLDVVVRNLRAAEQQLPAELTPQQRTRADWLIASTVWISSNAVAENADRAAGELYGERNLATSASQETWLPSKAEVFLRDMADRARGAEQIMSVELAGRRHRPDGGSFDGLNTALAKWDVAATRALVQQPSTAVIAAVARTESLLAGAMDNTLSAAARARAFGELDLANLESQFTRLQAAWNRVAQHANTLLFDTRPLPDELRHAGSSVHAAVRGPIEHHASSPQLMRQMASMLSTHAGSSITIAATAGDVVRSHEVMVPASMLRELVKAQLPRGEERWPSEVLSIKNLHRNEAIPLPEPLRHVLTQPLEAATRESATTLDAAAGLDITIRSVPGTPRPVPTLSHREPQLPPATTGPASAPGR